MIKLIHLLGKKWSLPLIHCFYINKSLTYNSILNNLEKDINPTILSNRLKSFEKYKIIRKIDNQGYEITRFGEKIIDIIHDLKSEIIEVNLEIPNECSIDKCGISNVNNNKK